MEKLTSRRIVASIAFVLLVSSGAAPAQDLPAQDLPAAGGPELSEGGLEAVEKLKAGDRAAAIEILENLRESGNATPVDLALLGNLYIESGRAAEGLAVLEPLVEGEGADPAALYNAGHAALVLGRIETAVGYLERSVRHVPVSPAARDLGLIRSAQGLEGEAFRLLRPWVAENPDDLQARLAAILSALKLGRADEAAPWLEGLPEGDPRVVLLRGQHLAQTGDPGGAVEVLEKILGNHPPKMRPDLYRLLAEAYTDVGRPRDALALFQAEPGKEPLPPDPRIALLEAEAHYRLGELDEAVSALRPFAEQIDKTADRGGPLALQVALDYGRFLVAAGSAEEALAYLQTATRIAPEDEAAWKGLADALMWLGRRAEAAEALGKSTSLAQKKVEAKREQQIASLGPSGKSIDEARVAFTKGEPERALAILRRAIAEELPDVWVRLLEIRLLVALERHQEAFESAEETLALFPEHPEAWYYHGVVHMARQDPEAAEADFRRALEIQPDHTAVMNDLAVILMARGEKAEAKKLLERVLELRPEDPMAAKNLEQLKP